MCILISSKNVCFNIAPKNVSLDNVGSLRYSGRLFRTIGLDAIKERRPLCRQFNWRHDEQFRQVFRSSTMNTAIHCYGYPELNTVRVTAVLVEVCALSVFHVAVIIPV